ncbi:hypothetical protein [Bifidobacterium pseudocatenulatum]|uniref:hypothetical protein n=1 Tax=Bifidobacterium pseudocatenulatum TaxID=28026 RepID=UPI0006BFC6FE|nr:hypothetical protein [Bifidobacterium pseudocatenulatum]CUO04934.1 tail type measure protein [Bifidobacterium pseudocatenulatum]
MAATNVHFSFKDSQGHPKAGTLHFAPVRRHISGSTVVVQGGFDVPLESGGTATVPLEPTDNTFAWRVNEFPDDTNSSFERVVQVPSSTSTVEYTSLVDVDASTLAPALNSGTVLTYLLASSPSEAQAMSAANPGQMVFYPEGQAKTVASQILEDLTDARAVVEAQSAVAAQAANAAQAASDASQAASAQVTAVSDSITESKTVVESHANEALTAIDEAVKSVKDKASDVSGEDRTDAMPTDSASSQEV